MQQTEIRSFRLRLGALGLFLVLLVQATGVAATPFELKFDVDVIERATHDGLVGVNIGLNWVVDTAYTGEPFSLLVRFDSADLVSSRRVFGIGGDGQLHSTPATPLDPALNAVLSRWPPASFPATVQLSQDQVFPSGAGPALPFELGLLLESRGSMHNSPDFISSTDWMQRRLRLEQQDLFILGEIFPYGQLDPAQPMTGQQVQEFLDYFVLNGGPFQFSQSAFQDQGTFDDFFNDNLYREGERYSGTARLVSATRVPVPGTLAMLLLGLVGLGRWHGR